MRNEQSYFVEMFRQKAVKEGKMKKNVIVAVFLFVVVVTDSFGQTMSDGVSLVRDYSQLFLSGNGRIAAKYLRAVNEDDSKRIAALGGDSELIDTPIEIALLSRSAGVVNIRPVEASQMLANLTPKQQDEQFGMHVYKDMQILRFLGNTKAVGYHEAVLQFDIIARGNVSRAEVEAYYRQNIAAYVASIVDDEFGKTGRDGIVPAQVYATWKAKGVAQGTDAIALIKETLTNFFLNPTRANYESVCGIRARYIVTSDSMTLVTNRAYINTILVLSEALGRKLDADVHLDNAETLAKIPPDPRFNVFSVLYVVGQAAR